LKEKLNLEADVLARIDLVHKHKIYREIQETLDHSELER
jgi:hypothetical protein